MVVPKSIYGIIFLSCESEVNTKFELICQDEELNHFREKLGRGIKQSHLRRHGHGSSIGKPIGSVSANTQLMGTLMSFSEAKHSESLVV